MKKIINKWRSLPDSARSSVAFMISSLLLTGLNFLTTPVFTRLMDQSQYGLCATYYSWLSILDVFALLGLTSAGVFNVGLNEHTGKRDRYISAILGLCNLVTLAVFGIIFLVKELLPENYILPDSLLFLMLLHFVFSPANIFWITRQKYEFKYRLSFTVTVVSAFVSQGISLLLVLLSSDTGSLANIKLWSAELAMMLFYVPIYIYILFKGKRFIDLSVWKSTLLFAVPLLPHYLAQHVMAGADTVMISKMVSEADAGIYSVVSTIGKVSTVVWGAINVSLIAATFDAMNKKDYRSIQKTVNLLIIAYGAVVITVCLIAPEVLFVLAPASYKDGVYAVPPIAAGAFLSAFYNVYANVEFYHKKAFSIAVSTITATTVNILLNLWLIPYFGYVGAAYTTLASYVVLIFMHYLGYKRANEPIYRDGQLFAIGLVTVVLCVLTGLLYFSVIIRYSLIFAMIIAVLVFYKRILQALNTFLGKSK